MPRINHRWYWTQIFADSLTAAQTVSTDQLSTANLATDTVSKFITLTDNPDTYSNSDYGATIDAKGGDDSITNSGLIVSISGGNAGDTISNSGSFATINAGMGDDSISLAAQEILIQYSLGDGNDTVSGLNSTDTVSISGGEFTPATLGNDIVVGVGNDSITLTDAAGVQILGERSKIFIGTSDAEYIINDATRRF